MDKVKPGEKISIKANDWNKLADMVNSQSPRVGGKATSNNTPSGCVLVRNTTEAKIDAYGIVALGDFCVQPYRGQTLQRPVFDCGYAQKTRKNRHVTYAVAQDVIKPGQVGLAMIDGTTIVRTLRYAASPDFGYITPRFIGSWIGEGVHAKTQFKILSWPFFGSGSSVTSNYRFAYCRVSADVANSVVLAKTSSSYDGYGYYSIYLYENGLENGITGNAKMYLPRSAYGQTLGSKIVQVSKMSQRTMLAEYIDDEEEES